MPKTLADLVHEKVNADTLPRDEPVKLWVGPGSGNNTCAVCDKPILPAQTEFEAMYEDGRPPIRFHFGCYGLWEAERRRGPYFREQK